MCKKPVVSLVMPCYNSANYIVEAVNSVLSQDYECFELIIVDDGPVDSTSELVSMFNDDRIRFFRLSSNFGLGYAMNFGIRKSKGKYIAVADSGDVSFSRRISTQLFFLENNPNIYCLGSGYILIDSEGGFICDIYMPESYKQIQTHLFIGNAIDQSTMMFRRSVFFDYGICYDETLLNSADYDFVFRVSEKFVISNIQECLVNKRGESGEILIAGIKRQSDFANIIRRKQLDMLGVQYSHDDFLFHLSLIHNEYLRDEELLHAESWLNNLIEANERCNMFDSEEFYQLCNLLLWAALKGNGLGDWSIEKELLNYIKRILVKGSSVFEFGSGKGTEALLVDYDVTSIEHNIDFCFQRASNHNCVFAPIVNGWYDLDIVSSVLSEEFSFVLIDGPPGDLRYGILNNLKLFEGIEAIFIFDDVHREKDFNAMNVFCEYLNLKYEVVKCKAKSFAICASPLFFKQVLN